MTEALRIYLSDMPESTKLALIREQFVPLAVMLDSMTGSSIIQTWGSEDTELEAAFIAANWI